MTNIFLTHDYHPGTSTPPEKISQDDASTKYNAMTQNRESQQEMSNDRSITPDKHINDLRGFSRAFKIHAGVNRPQNMKSMHNTIVHDENLKQISGFSNVVASTTLSDVKIVSRLNPVDSSMGNIMQSTT